MALPNALRMLPTLIKRIKVVCMENNLQGVRIRPSSSVNGGLWTENVFPQTPIYHISTILKF